MISRIQVGLLALTLVIIAGCKGSKQPSFPDLNPVKGTVKRGDKTVTGGVVTFNTDPPSSEFMINSEVGTDGSYSLSTVRSTDTKGERKPGAPAGKYTVTYRPPLAEQAPGVQTDPTPSPRP